MAARAAAARDDDATQTAHALRTSLRELNRVLERETAARAEAERALAAHLLAADAPPTASPSSSSADARVAPDASASASAAADDAPASASAPSSALPASGAQLADELAALRRSDAALKAELMRLAQRLADSDERMGATTRASLCFGAD